MAKLNSTDQKLRERCDILETVIQSVAGVYHDTNTTEDQKSFIETIIGAAIWYLPHSEKYWTGKISKVAKDVLMQNGKATLTKEHQYPRKLAAKELLHMNFEKVSIHELYEAKYAKYNLVTPQENKKISAHQRSGVFVDIETAYNAAGIELLEITKNEIGFYKKGL